MKTKGRLLFREALFCDILPLMGYYLAPLEGITDYNFRNAYSEIFGGVDKMFTPFLAPNSTKKFPTRELKNIDTSINDVNLVVPQLLTNNAEHFIWAMEKIVDRGFNEINFNLGCPSGTVVTKKKGSGLLFYPDEMDTLLTEIFDAADKLDCKISIKTRLGKNDPDEFYEILDIYNKYPIHELTIHPRIQQDIYKGNVRMEYFDYAYEHSKNPLVYNGDIVSNDGLKVIEEKYPDLAGIMLGRGLIAKPWILTTDEPDMEGLWRLHDAIFAELIATMSGDLPTLHHMKELWALWHVNFENQAKDIKALMKTKKLSEYQIIINRLREK